MTTTSADRRIRIAAYNLAVFQQDGQPVWTVVLYATSSSSGAARERALVGPAAASSARRQERLQPAQRGQRDARLYL